MNGLSLSSLKDGRLGPFLLLIRDFIISPRLSSEYDESLGLFPLRDRYDWTCVISVLRDRYDWTCAISVLRDRYDWT